MSSEALGRGRVGEIIVLHGEIGGLLKTSLKKAIRIGELMTEQKASLKHGEFTPWIKANLPFTDRTARKYMQLYENRELLKTENVSGLTGAYKLLEAPKPTFREQIHALRKRITAVYLIKDDEKRLRECVAIRDEALTMAQDAAERLLDAEVALGRAIIEAQKADEDYETISKKAQEAEVAALSWIENSLSKANVRVVEPYKAEIKLLAEQDIDESVSESANRVLGALRNVA